MLTEYAASISYQYVRRNGVLSIEAFQSLGGLSFFNPHLHRQPRKLELNDDWNVAPQFYQTSIYIQLQTLEIIVPNFFFVIHDDTCNRRNDQVQKEILLFGGARGLP